MDDHIPKHHNNLLKTVEGTGWLLCDALNTMVRNEISPSTVSDISATSLLANNITEMFQVVAECEEPNVIDHLAEKIIEFADDDLEMFMSFMDENIGDNPLYKRVTELSNEYRQ